MANILKRVASVVLGEEGDMPSVKKVAVEGSVGDQSNVKLPEVDNSGVNANADSNNPKAEPSDKANEDGEDDDLFGELNEPVNRIIEKPSELKVNVPYQLVDIYSMTIDERLATVGGFKTDEEDVKYVWMPTSLVKNYDSKKVLELKSKLDKGKKGYAVYKGMRTSKYGTACYDMVWVQKGSK